MKPRPHVLLLGWVVLIAACTPTQRDHAASHDPPPENPPAEPPPPPVVEPPVVVPPPIVIPPDGMVVHRQPGAVIGVGVDEGGTIWTVDGAAIWAHPPGGTWTRYAGVGQLAAGDRAYTVCGGEAGEAYVGYETVAIPDPEHSTPEERAQGDVDRVALDAVGNLAVEHHYEIHNNNGINPDGTIKDKKSFDETRTILSCVRVNEGPFRGEVYFGSNHGLTRVRGDLYGDHRHPTFDYPSCAATIGTDLVCDELPEAIGYVWGLALSNALNPMMAADWMFAEVGPSDPAATHDLVRWTLSSHPWIFQGPPAFPLPGKTAPAWAPPWYARWPLLFDARARNRAIAQTPDGRYWVASEKYGLVWFDRDAGKLRPFVEVLGEPGTIVGLASNPDGSLWIGTSSAGVWRYTPPPRPAALAAPPEPEAGTWEKLDGLPSQEVFRIYLETRFGKRQLYVGTADGLAVLTQ
jgi:hypothetical protein